MAIFRKMPQVLICKNHKHCHSDHREYDEYYKIGNLTFYYVKSIKKQLELGMLDAESNVDVKKLVTFLDPSQLR